MSMNCTQAPRIYQGRVARLGSGTTEKNYPLPQTGKRDYDDDDKLIARWSLPSSRRDAGRVTFFRRSSEREVMCFTQSRFGKERLLTV